MREKIDIGIGEIMGKIRLKGRLELLWQLHRNKSQRGGGVKIRIFHHFTGSSSGWADWATGGKKKSEKNFRGFLPLEFPHSICRSHSSCEEEIWVFREKNGKLGLSHCTPKN